MAVGDSGPGLGWMPTRGGAGTKEEEEGEEEEEFDTR